VNTFFKRAGAYIFDFMIVALLVSLLSYVPFLNPKRMQYSEKYNELLNVYEQFNQNEISEEEYNEAYVPISYELYRLNTNYVILDLVVVLCYFGVLPYFLKGQTLGKKLFQIRIVSASDKPITVVNYMLRSIVLNNVIISIALQAVVYLFDVSHYATIYQNINLVGYLMLYICLFMVMVRSDNRGLHDIIAGTKVVYDTADKDRDAKIIEEQKVLEAESEVTIKTKNKKKNSKVKK